jgi:two-component system response regulator AtoC
MEDAEEKIIRETLRCQKGNNSRTADVLGIGRKTLDRKLAGWPLRAQDETRDTE